LNGLITLLFGISAPLSVLILILSVVIIYINFSRPNSGKVNIYLILIIATYVLYLMIASCSLLWNSELLNDSTSIFSLYRSYISSLIIIAAYYYGINSMLQERTKKFSLDYYTPFFIVTLLFVVFGAEFGLYESFVGTNDTFGDERSSGLFANPNEAGAFANYALVIFLAIFSATKKKILYLVFAALAITASVLSFSKAALIISTLVIIFFLFRSAGWYSYNSKSFKRYLVFFFFIIFGLSSYLLVNFSDLSKNLTRNQKIRVAGTLAILTGEINVHTTSHRTEVYKHGWELIKKNPIFGHGLGTFHKFNSGRLHFGVHNTFLLIQGESGILPFILFVSLFIHFFIRGLRLKNLEMGFFVSGVVIVYFLNVCGTSHNALDERTSNALIGTIIAIFGNTNT
jgi:O-antigen ligase